MDLNKYQELAKGTALPGAWSLNYLVPGLAGETGELAEQLNMINQVPEDIKSELADHYWFLALICELMDWSLSHKVLPDHQDISNKLSEGFSEQDNFLRLCVAVGEMNSAFAKSVRDNGGNLNEKRAKQIEVNVRNVFYLVGAIAANRGFTIAELMESNIEKLYGRKARGVLGGVDGNNR